MQCLYLIPLVLTIILGIYLYVCKNRKPVLDIILISGCIVCVGCTLALCFASSDLKLSLFKITEEMTLMFKVDVISKIFGLLISVIWLIVSIFSIKYMDKEENVNKFYAYSLLTLAFMLGLSYSGNILTMYIIYEFVTLASIL